jgi:hypothetical protein
MVRVESTTRIPGWIVMFLFAWIWPFYGARADQPLLAVFDIQVKRIELDPGLVTGLTDYLASRLVETGKYKVVPRAQLKKQLSGEKKKSFRQCYDQSCQIEIGREVAAQKILSTQILKVGSDCNLSATLFDLRQAAAERAATVRSKCDEEKLSEAIDLLTVKLAGQPADKKKSGFRGQQLVNGSGLCLDVHDKDIHKNGGRVQLWTCIETAINQRWRLEGEKLISEGGLCLDAHDLDMKKNGGRVQVWECSDAINQKWRRDGKRLVNGGGLCLDAHEHDSTKSGCRIQVWECNLQYNQSWTFR